MKIFIIHASAGSGHKKVAEAILEEVHLHYEKQNVMLFDILDYTQWLYKFLYSQGYIFLITRIQWLWRIFFYCSNMKIGSSLSQKIRCYINSKFCTRFITFLEKENPDVIISTHFLVNEQVSYLKEKKLISSKLISVVTDFGVHRFWIADNVDTYVVASQKTKDILIAERIKESKIKICGIPIRKQFLKQMDRVQVREGLGIKNALFTVLVLTGGIGIGPIYEIVRLFNDEINVIVVCGNNDALVQRLSQLGFKHLIVFGWIENVEEVMRAADVIITKPGGSSISESLVMGLPMFFFSIIPGQEAFNARVMSEYGTGFTVTMKNIREKVFLYKDAPEKLSEIKQKMSSFSSNKASQNIIALINE